jgi:hypothetical protein
LNDPFDNQFDLHVDIDREVARALALRKLWEVYSRGLRPAVRDSVGDQLLLALQRGIPQAQFEAAMGPALMDSFVRLEQLAGGLHEQLRPLVAQHKLLCLSLTGASIPMWAYYADNHRGVVLSFRCVPGADDPWPAGRAVRYQEAMPRLLDEELLSDIIAGHGHIEPTEALHKTVLTKSVAWAHECEWRIFSGAGRNPDAPFEDVPFNALQLDAVIVGCCMQPADRAGIVDLAQRLYPHARVRKAVTHSRRFELCIEPLEA